MSQPPLKVSSAESKAASAPSGSGGAISQCEPYRQVVIGKLDQGLTARRVYQDLVFEHGFSGSYYSVRRFVRRLGDRHPLPFRRMECQRYHEALRRAGGGELGKWLMATREALADLLDHRRYSSSGDPSVQRIDPRACRKTLEAGLPILEGMVEGGKQAEPKSALTVGGVTEVDSAMNDWREVRDRLRKMRTGAQLIKVKRSLQSVWGVQKA
ncbi:MAG: hypothetical protein GXY55_19595 [Phycisphaerae bacterium]|nr:hypothetical protein [Phycisphaerae bacterium]